MKVTTSWHRIGFGGLALFPIYGAALHGTASTIPEVLLREMLTPQFVFMFVAFLAFLFVSIVGGRVGGYPLLTVLAMALPMLVADYDFAMGREVTFMGPVGYYFLLFGLALAFIPSVFAALSRHRGWWLTPLTLAGLIIGFAAMEQVHLALTLPLSPPVMYSLSTLVLALSVYGAYHISTAHPPRPANLEAISVQKGVEEGVEEMAGGGEDTEVEVGHDGKEGESFALRTVCPYCGIDGQTAVPMPLILESRVVMVRCRSCKNYFSVALGD